MDVNEQIGGPMICQWCGSAFNFNSAHVCIPNAEKVPSFKTECWRMDGDEFRREEMEVVLLSYHKQTVALLESRVAELTKALENLYAAAREIPYPAILANARAALAGIAAPNKEGEGQHG